MDEELVAENPGAEEVRELMLEGALAGTARLLASKYPDCASLAEDAVYEAVRSFLAKRAGCYTHPYEDRALTLREGARLQTFPDKYRFTGAVTSRARMIGNAVPCLMGSVLGAHIAEYLENPSSRTRS